MLFRSIGLCFSALIHAKIRLQNVRYKKEKKQLFNKVGYTWTSSKETEMKSDGPESCVRLKLPLGPFKKTPLIIYIYYILHIKPLTKSHNAPSLSFPSCATHPTTHNNNTNSNMVRLRSSLCFIFFQATLKK